MSGLVYKAPSKVPDEAYAVGDDGKPAKPRITYGKATPEQRAAYSTWQTPVTYLRHQETFLGTKRQAQLRIEECDFCVRNGFGQWVSEDGKPIIELTIGDNAATHPGCIIEWRDAKGWHCDGSGRRYSRTCKRNVIKRHYEGLNYHELRQNHPIDNLGA